MDSVAYNGQFDQLYPDGKWDQMNSKERADVFEKWNQSLSDAAKVSMTAQSSLQRIGDYNRQAGAILQRSSTADGEVRQLQSVNQMLGIVLAQMGDIGMVLATNSRITAQMAAESAKTEEAIAATNRQLLRGMERTPKKKPVKLQPIR